MVRVRIGDKTLFDADLADSFASKLLGIMFRGTVLRAKFSRPLLFVFSRESRRENSIHSFFCFEKFDAVFLDSKKEITETIPSIRPWNPLIVPKAPCKYLIELPSGKAGAFGLKEGAVLSFKTGPG